MFRTVLLDLHPLSCFVVKGQSPDLLVGRQLLACSPNLRIGYLLHSTVVYLSLIQRVRSGIGLGFVCIVGTLARGTWSKPMSRIKWKQGLSCYVQGGGFNDILCICRKAYRDVELMIDLLPDERDRQIVSMRYGLTDGQCKSFKEIASSLPEPISSGFARTVFVRAMSRLRELKYLMEPAGVAVYGHGQ